MDLRTLLFFTCLFSMSAGASDIFDSGVPSFDRIDSTSSFSIKDLVEGPDGRIWVGSQRGVFYLDGERLVKPHSLRQREDRFHYYYVTKIWFDTDGDMFVGTRGRGVFQFDRSKEKWSSLIEITLKNVDDHPLRETISDFASAGEGHVWISTAKELCLFTKIDSSLVCREDAHGQSFGSITSLYANKNALYLGTQNGLLVLQYDAAAPSKIQGVETLLANIHVSSIVGDARNRLWVTSSNKGSFRLDSDGTIMPLAGSLNAVDAAIHEHGVWIATEDQGLQVFDYDSATLSKEYRSELENPFSIPSDSSSCLLIDKSGLLWIGSNGLGVSRTRVENKSIRLLLPTIYDPLSLSASNVRFIKEMNNGEIWFAVLGHGVDVIDPNKNTKRSYVVNTNDPGALQSSDIYAIEQDKSGDIWLISKSGSLYQYHDETDSFTRVAMDGDFPIEALYYLLVLNNGDLLILGKGGATIRSKSSGEFSLISPIKNGEALGRKTFYMASQFDNGDVWLNGNQHLYLVSAGSLNAEQITFQMQGGEPLPHGIVIGPMIGVQGEFYVNKGGALLRQVGDLDDGSATLELIEPMFASQFNSFIAEDGDWWGYNHLIDGESLNAVKFGSVDNVPMKTSWIVSKELASTGTMLFGSSVGVVMIKPELYKAPQHKPAPLVLSVSLDEQAVDYYQGTVKVPEYVKGISFEFFTPDYSEPEMNAYAYRLVGYTEKWTEIDAINPKASFTNLAPGEYVFELKGSNRFGVWADVIEQLRIIVEPKWFQTHWFRLLTLVTILLATYALYRYRVRSLRRQGQKLSRLVHERTQALESSLKELKQTQAQLVLSEKMASLGRLVRGVAHEINTPLGIVKMAASNLSDRLNLGGREEQNDKILSVLRGSFDLMEKNIDRISRLVSSFKDIAPDEHAVEVERFKVSDAIESCLVTMHQGLANVDVKLCGDIEVTILGYKDGFTLVVTEIVSNAIKHAWPVDFESQKSLKISWYNDGQQLTLCISDNGSGIGSEFEGKIFDPFFTANNDTASVGLGLHKVYLLVSQQLGGAVEYRQSSSNGSEFSVQLPLLCADELPESAL